MAENDVQLDLKKRARRRLVGAIALALVAAIVLPMVMDSEPRPDGNELSIRIPSQEGANYASRLITGSAPPPVKPALPVEAASSVASASSSEAPVVAIARSSSSASVSPAPLPQSATSSSSSKAPAKVVLAREEEARAREILEGHASPAPATSAKYYVQLGVYREESNAREVSAKALASGVKAGLEKQAGRTRVKSGPYADRASADKIVVKLKKAGLSGIVTNK